MQDRTCSANDCSRQSVARGFCLKHYKRYMKHGDPEVVKRDGTVLPHCLICGAVNPENRRKYCSEPCLRLAQSEQIRQWVVDNPDRSGDIRRRSQAKRRYTRHNIPSDLVRPTACEICGDETEMHVDHDHRCCPGKYSCGECVAGFLCTNCNNGLGRFKDNPARLRAAAEYIERTRGVRVTDLVDRLVTDHRDLVEEALAAHRDGRLDM